MFSSKHHKHTKYNPFDLMEKVLEENPGLSNEELREKLHEELKKLKEQE